VGARAVAAAALSLSGAPAVARRLRTLCPTTRSPATRSPAARSTCQLLHLVVQLAEAILELLRAGELARQLPGLAVRGSVGRGELLGGAIERARQLLLCPGLAFCFVDTRTRGGLSRGSSLGAVAALGRGAHRVGGLLHALRDLLAFDVLGGFRGRALLLHRILQLPGPLGQAILFPREPADGVLTAFAARARAGERLRDLTLRVGELARLELHLADRAPLLVRAAGLQLPLDLAQLLQ